MPQENTQELELTIRPNKNGNIWLSLGVAGRHFPEQVWFTDADAKALDVVTAFLRERGRLGLDALCDHLMSYTHRVKGGS